MNEETGEICDYCRQRPGPTADLMSSKSRACWNACQQVGRIGDLAYLGIAAAHPQQLGATPRQTTPGKTVRQKTCASIARSRSGGSRWSTQSGRIRRYASLSEMDRHHRQQHSARTRAVAGLVNRQIRSRLPC